MTHIGKLLNNMGFITILITLCRRCGVNFIKLLLEYGKKKNLKQLFRTVYDKFKNNQHSEKLRIVSEEYKNEIKKFFRSFYKIFKIVFSFIRNKVKGIDTSSIRRILGHFRLSKKKSLGGTWRDTTVDNRDLTAMQWHDPKKMPQHNRFQKNYEKARDEWFYSDGIFWGGLIVALIVITHYFGWIAFMISLGIGILSGVYTLQDPFRTVIRSTKKNAVRENLYRAHILALMNGGYENLNRHAKQSYDSIKRDAESELNKRKVQTIIAQADADSMPGGDIYEILMRRNTQTPGHPPMFGENVWSRFNGLSAEEQAAIAAGQYNQHASDPLVASIVEDGRALTNVHPYGEVLHAQEATLDELEQLQAQEAAQVWELSHLRPTPDELEQLQAQEAA